MKKLEKLDKSIQMWGITLVSSDIDRVLSLLITQVQTEKTLFKVVTPNPEQIIQSRNNPVFRQALAEADLALPDGVGLVWASRILASRLGQPALSARIAGRAVVAELISRLGESHSILVIGGKGYLPSDRESSQPQQLEVSGVNIWWMPGYADVHQPISLEESAVRSALTQLKPAIVLVAFGAPQQEAWMVAHQEILEKIDTRVVMAVGGSIDYVLGKTSPVPAWVSQVNLEWLFRLITQPWRWRRQLRLVSFIWLVVRTWFNPRLSD